MKVSYLFKVHIVSVYAWLVVSASLPGSFAIQGEEWIGELVWARPEGEGITAVHIPLARASLEAALSRVRGLGSMAEVCAWEKVEATSQSLLQMKQKAPVLRFCEN